MEKLSPREIIIIGGEKAVSKQVEEELKKLAKERVTDDMRRNKNRNQRRACQANKGSEIHRSSGLE